MSLSIECDIKVDSEPCVAGWDNMLFVGNEDGSIKSYDDQLSEKSSWSAHPVQAFALTAANGKVYSSSNDGSIKVWSPQGEKIADIPTLDADVGVLCCHGDELYAGDEAGNVIVYDKVSQKAIYNLMEEIKGLIVDPPYLFTVRDLDITITEVYPSESKSKYSTRHTMEGRPPLVLVGNKLLAMARGGNDLCLHDGTLQNKYKKLCQVKASDMIITSMVASKENVWTAGWDGHIRQWKIVGDKLELNGDVNLGSCINALVNPSSEQLFAIVTGGRIVKIKIIN